MVRFRLQGNPSLEGLLRLAVLTLMIGLTQGCSKASLLNKPNQGRRPAAPQIFNVTPTRGPTVGGTQVTITGSGFGTGVSVQIGDAECLNIQVISASMIVCQTPPHIAGNVSITIRMPGFQPYVMANAFVYYDSLNPIPGYAITNGGGVLRVRLPLVEAGAARGLSTIGEVQKGYSLLPVENDIQHRVGLAGTDPFF